MRIFRLVYKKSAPQTNEKQDEMKLQKNGKWLPILEGNLKRIFEIRWSNYVKQNKGQKEGTCHTTKLENQRVY